MTIFFCPSNALFYDSMINTVIPEDSLEITEELREEMLLAQVAGKRIIAGPDGYPIAADPLPLTPAEILAANTSIKNQLLAEATIAIAPLQDAVDIGESTPAEETLLLNWKKYRVAVNRIDLTLASPTWPVKPA